MRQIITLTPQVACPTCGRLSTIDHVEIGETMIWRCDDQCGVHYQFTRLSETEVDIEPTGVVHNQVYALMQLKTDETLTIMVKHDRNTAESEEEFLKGMKYFLNENTCPTNYLRGIRAIFIGEQADQHGLFEYVGYTDKVEELSKLLDEGDPSLSHIMNEFESTEGLIMVDSIDKTEVHRDDFDGDELNQMPVSCDLNRNPTLYPIKKEDSEMIAKPRRINMPRDFEDACSLHDAAKRHDFRSIIEGESDEHYREALANHVTSIDIVEANEIRHGIGWDRQSKEQLDTLGKKSIDKTILGRGIVTHDDKKEKYQSWEAKANWDSSNAMGHGAIAVLGYGATEEESIHNLKGTAMDMCTGVEPRKPIRSNIPDCIKDMSTFEETLSTLETISKQVSKADYDLGTFVSRTLLAQRLVSIEALTKLLTKYVKRSEDHLPTDIGDIDANLKEVDHDRDGKK